MTRLSWISGGGALTQKRQCTLAGVARATVYANRKPVLIVEIDVLLKRLIDEEYTRHPFYGSRKMVVYLGRCGHKVNRKRVQRLMRSMGLAAIAPGPNTSWAHPQHKVYPYLLRGVAVTSQSAIHLVKAFRDLMQKTKCDLRDRLPKLYSQDLLNNLFRYPYTKIEFIERELGVSRPTATKYLEQLTSAGLVRKQKMGRSNFYINEPLYALLSGVSLEQASNNP